MSTEIIAAAAAEMQRQEEEEMITYSPNDLSDDWEFKILRSNFATFRNPAKLRAVLEEERRGGWVLVEKFDDYRIRLKRPASAKALQGDFADSYEPYRTTLGTNQGAVVAVVILCAALVLIGVMSLVFILKASVTVPPLAPPAALPG